jgi:hypothetical protein
MRSLLIASLLASAACSSAYADQVALPQPAGPRTALAIAPERTRAPYDVQVITEDGDTAPTYAMRGRYYVQGNLNQRSIIRVTNPTPSRVEAVVSVDGLDVVDGESGDLAKRGYIVPAYGEVRIEGFRTSLADVATFRFSSVDGSYAGRKGKARNVGVIAVAIFEEQAPPPVTTQTAPRTNRLGLGTEFGEQRYSAASYTKFVRAPGRPIAIAELRYNDVQGLMALGIPVAPMPDEGEIMMRETADPFPGDHFARPPR